MAKATAGKLVTIIDSDGNEHTAFCTVLRSRKARGSNTFSRTAKVRGRDCARARFARQTDVRIGR
tara:strand:- start:1465 stop:1659 length:195 start_codon:yes stop_codon:yes gene_type:complete